MGGPAFSLPEDQIIQRAAHSVSRLQHAADELVRVVGERVLVAG
jgi:hypothetical protein